MLEIVTSPANDIDLDSTTDNKHRPKQIYFSVI